MADEMKLVGADNQNAAYQGDNTDSYAASIQQQYDKLAQQQAAAVNENVNEGVSALTYMKDTVAPELARQNLTAAKADRAEAIDRRDGIEINNGNRQQIGRSQYDIIENTYDNQREAIVDQQRKLELDTARQIADLRSKGDYAKADAALQSAQEKFKQLYKDSMRADANLRANYEYGTSLKREDEKIVRDEERMNTKWLRSLGESFLQRGVMPSDGMLQAMGLDKDTAQLYVNAVLYGGYGYGGGGGGGGRSSGGSGGGSGSSAGTGLTDMSDYDDNYYRLKDMSGITSAGRDIAQQALEAARNGDLVTAQNLLGNAAGTEIYGSAVEKWDKKLRQEYRTGQMLATDEGQRKRAGTSTSSSSGAVSQKISTTAKATTTSVTDKAKQQAAATAAYQKKLAQQQAAAAAKAKAQAAKTKTSTTAKRSTK